MTVRFNLIVAGIFVSLHAIYKTIRFSRIWKSSDGVSRKDARASFNELLRLKVLLTDNLRLLSSLF
jgi:hypothetical protein